MEQYSGVIYHHLQKKRKKEQSSVKELQHPDHDRVDSKSILAVCPSECVAPEGTKTAE